MSLIKDQPVDSTYNQVDLPKTKSAQVVDSLFEMIKKTLENGENFLTGNST